jgi:hypothetical protein
MRYDFMSDYITQDLISIMIGNDTNKNISFDGMTGFKNSSN